MNSTWYRAEPNEAEEQAFARLKRSCFRTGRELEEVQLGLPNQVGGTGVSIPTPRPPVTPGGLFPGVTPVVPPVPGVPPISPDPLTPTIISPPIQPPPSAVIRQSNGAKSGINLLGDIERWGLPDAERLAIATLTLRGLSVKELRELCTKLPPKLLAELQITSNPEQQGGTGK